jgi:hypothetical protein
VITLNANKKDLKYWVGFSLIPGIGRVRFGHLESYFKTMKVPAAPPAN